MIAVSAWLDERSEVLVRDIWRQMAKAAVDESLHAGPYRPHITLGIWEEVRVDAASTRLKSLASEVSVFPLTFRAIGIFPGHGSDPGGTPGVYLVPSVTPELHRLHEGVHALVAGVGAGPIYRYVPGRWEPHCTVAWRLATHRISRAVDVVIDAGVLPLAATITRIGLIETPAEIELDCLQLAE
jgi:2'-5' RNA ligase